MGPIMTEPLSRDDVIAWLEKLGAERDEEVLEAARQVHARIAASGMTWEDLLVSEGGATGENDDTDDDESDDADDIDDEADEADDDESADDADDTGESDDDYDTDDDESADDTGESDDTGAAETPDPEEETTPPTGKAGKKHADSMALIGELLAKPDISADMREELEGYKADIAAGEFTTGDRRYLSAVHKRLCKRR
jgi:hypothetical protein